jgi:two-component system, OmpR family, phosphate regulon sensor histidine kinase PhoR
MPDWTALILAALLAAVTTASAAFWIMRLRWTSPVRRLTRQMSQIVQADWHGEIPAAGPPELRQLANRFNQFAAETQHRLTDIQHRQTDLNALVDTLPDPILASDAQGRLILMNAPAARLLLLSSGQALGQKVVSVIADEPVVELFEAVAELPATLSPTVQREVKLTRGGQKITCEAVASRMPGGGTLVVLRDVSTLARAIQMKTDFVANASHELRTPITAIKIAFETLRDAFDNDPEQVSKCMVVIDGNLRRLEEMLRDLLDLSRVEGPEHQPAAVVVKSAEMFSAVRGSMLPVAQQKQVELIFEEPRPEQFISDGRLLNLILKNLVENGIKYTHAGGKVTVRLTGLEADEPQVTLSVSDTGIGIAPEHIDRVFERFYQVDASRSSSAGRGTGLGLAIVRHAVHALGGSVRLESEVGVGTTVTCVFPQPAEPEAMESVESGAI